MPEFDYDQVTPCKYSMSRNEVVEILQGELTLLRSELESRDKIVAELISQAQHNAEQAEESGGPLDPAALAYVDQVLLLQNLEEANQVVHDTLRPVAADIRRRAMEAEKTGQREWTDADRLSDRQMHERTKRYSQ